jgi:hypothetical protein
MLHSSTKFVLTALAATGVVALEERALLNQTYDYVIVGGGTAGLTLANRLTENANSIYPFLYHSLTQRPILTSLLLLLLSLRIGN